MTDPYNSNPYQAPASVAQPPSPPRAMQRDAIAQADVSDTWKRRFRTIEAAGGPKLPRFKELPFGERAGIQFNILAFLFGPFYFLAKGLWRQALAYVIIAITCVLVMELIGLGKFANGVGYVFAALYATRANISYYQRVIQQQALWL
ncbi:hypothetical protein ARC78_00770 [Stenotrophomonas pictorum JCM 9942]|uniref:DUF2628 domain-containing protein n=2 Tax=Stenotrophomonas pictorum TaxID=86184 RepID=A0A0R0AQV0_9GAMM|nr:hypothetical protein ARC78_00770 [Stenotrophomonas pictorum JCM 9942]